MMLRAPDARGARVDEFAVLSIECATERTQISFGTCGTCARALTTRKGGAQTSAMRLLCDDELAAAIPTASRITSRRVRAAAAARCARTRHER
jgi:hypothetical protein